MPESSLSPEHRKIGGQRLRRLGRLALLFTDPDKWLNLAIERPAVVSEAWWAEQQEAAQDLMQRRRGQPKVLLVVTAQHPLKDGRYPGYEFEARLHRGRGRALQLHDQGKEVEIYVPGSTHRHKGITDAVPLADAGTDWLAGSGLPEDIVLHGTDLNDQYKGQDGVYNSGDEAYVAASYFKDDERFGAFEVVCAPGQSERWQLHAVANGVLPAQQIVLARDAWHSNTAEQDRLVRYTQRVDPTWQGEDSFMANLTRYLRQPRG